MNFKSSSEPGRAVPAAEESPYARAGQAWDDRMGSARIQARNWRYMAFATAAMAVVATAALAHVAGRKQVATYVVEVDRLGMPGRVTLASEAYRPGDAQAGYFVAEVVRLARERPLDPVVMRKQWTKVYAFLAGDAVASMNQYAAADPGLDALGNRVARTVEVGSVLQRSKDAYQVRWVETTYANGVRRTQEQYTGLFSVTVRVPKNEEDVYRNPLGIYVSSFTWGREFVAPVQTSPQPTSPRAASRPAGENRSPGGRQ